MLGLQMLPSTESVVVTTAFLGGCRGLGPSRPSTGTRVEGTWKASDGGRVALVPQGLPANRTCWRYGTVPVRVGVVL